jgi:hypothetical protein
VRSVYHNSLLLELKIRVLCCLLLLLTAFAIRYLKSQICVFAFLVPIPHRLVSFRITLLGEFKVIKFTGARLVCSLVYNMVWE